MIVKAFTSIQEFFSDFYTVHNKKKFCFNSHRPRLLTENAKLHIVNGGLIALFIAILYRVSLQFYLK